MNLQIKYKNKKEIIIEIFKLFVIGVGLVSIPCQAEEGLSVYRVLANIYAGDEGLPITNCVFKESSTEAIQCFLEQGYNVNQTINDRGDAFLHIAVQYDDFASIKLLFEHKADPNIQNDLQQTPFHTAAGNETGEAAAIFLFMHGGADPTITDNKSFTPFYTAVLTKKQTLAELIWRIEGTNIDLNAKDNEGRTILHHLAAEMAKAINDFEDDEDGIDEDYNIRVTHILNFTRWLVSLPNSNINANARDEDGNTILHTFMYEAYDDYGFRTVGKQVFPFLKLLFEKGAGESCTIENKYNETPINAARADDNHRLARLLEGLCGD